MAHSFHSALYHCVFSTKDRRAFLDPEIQDRVWSYLGGIARDHAMCALQIGGMPDHVHILLSMPAALSLAEGMRHLKGVSSWWMHHELGRGNFGWQEGYGAFSIGVAQIEATRQYIERQTEHHQKRDYKAEFLAMLQRHGLTYDERYLWS